MDIVHFFMRYTPFWAVPLFMVAGEFAYVYWLKSYRKVAVISACLATFSFFSIGFYYWAGGPEKVVYEFELIRDDPN